ADPSAIALARGDNSLKLGKAYLRKCKRASKELAALREHLMEKYKDELPPPTDAEKVDEARGGPFIPFRLSGFLFDMEGSGTNEPDDSAPLATALQGSPDRDEGAALEEAARDLVRLDRYERRAWSQLKRGIYEFMKIKLMKGIAATKREPSSFGGKA